MDPTEIGKVLDDLGSRIGPYGEAAWQILVRQMVIEGTIGIIVWPLVLGISTIVGIVLLVWYKRIYVRDLEAWDSAVAKDEYRYRGDKPNRGERIGAVLIGLGAWACLLFLSVYFIEDAVIKLLNPEYVALMTLIRTIHP